MRTGADAPARLRTELPMNVKQTTAIVRELWPLLFVADIERSVAFYRDQLAFTLARRADDASGKLFWCRLERGGCSIMLQQAQEAEDGPAQGRGRGVIFYFI